MTAQSRVPWLSARRRARRSRRGFTLIELMIALLAGLIVAMGVVGLSRDATHTFHEEMRGSAAEAALRTAADRLRADLQRAGYMSTGNIILDPQIAHWLSAPAPANIANQSSTLAKGVGRLASIYRVPKGSYSKNLTGSTPDLSANNNVAPDLIDIGGNMTSSDQFPVQLIAQTPVGNCTQILLSPTSPAMYRVFASGLAAPQTMHDIFQPIPDGDKNQFIVRLVDDTGHAQYLVTCGNGWDGSTGGDAGISGIVGGGGGSDGGTINVANAQPYLWVNTQLTQIVTSSSRGSSGAGIAGVGGVSGYAAGVAWVNPVQVVQWEITSPSGTPADPEPAQDQAILAGTPLAPTTPDPTKFDLMRSYVDAVTGNIIADTSEIVAEYAVDLDFAFSVNTSVINTSPNVVSYGFEDPNDNDQWANDVNVAGINATVGPQRIRAVRARVVTRTSQPDRSVKIAVGNYGSQEFMYRYQIDANATVFARARTIVTQVALPNQAGSFY
jgi:prepilin-type N-terminal cleavage/methylation domain-containing protein